MNTNRVTEIATSFKSFTKEAYHKTEVLPELFELQAELVEKTFTESSNTAELKIWDVERRLDEMNSECGGIVTEQLEAFKKDCKYICNLIKAEMSGNRGEIKAFDRHSRIQGENKILKNIALSNKAFFVRCLMRRGWQIFRFMKSLFLPITESRCRISADL